MRGTKRIFLLVALGLMAGLAQSPARAQETPLHKAAAAGDKELVARLLAEGADVNAKDKDGHTPLHIAAMGGHKEVAEALLAKDAWVNAGGPGWLTPLHMAAQRNRKEVAELLLDRGADVNARTNATLQVPTHFIKLSPGHSVPVMWLEVVQGLTPLHFAAIGGASDVTALLLAKGAEVNAKNDAGWTPLHVAARWSRKEVAELLLANGADVNARTNFGVTPLHEAASEGNREVAELLLAKGADVNARGGDWSHTPLHFAVMPPDLPRQVREAYPTLSDDTGKIAVVELLLANGAAVNAKNGRGKTPLGLAETDEMRALLRKYGAK